MRCKRPVSLLFLVSVFVLYLMRFGLKVSEIGVYYTVFLYVLQTSLSFMILYK
jgi:hypothetical protein